MPDLQGTCLVLDGWGQNPRWICEGCLEELGKSKADTPGLQAVHHTRKCLRALLRAGLVRRSPGRPATWRLRR